MISRGLEDLLPRWCPHVTSEMVLAFQGAEMVLRARDLGFSPGEFCRGSKENEDLQRSLESPTLESKNIRIWGKEIQLQTDEEIGELKQVHL